MRIALVTETFPPEVNGVTRTLEQLARGLVGLGHELLVVRPRQPSDRDGSSPDVPWAESLHRGCPIPRYPGLRFGLPARRRLTALFTERETQVVHIATEGPLGLTALLAARSLGIPITSTYHTNFHQYGRFYGYGGVAELLMRYMRWFHNRTSVTLVPSKGVKASLEERGFGPVELLARGVDTRLFHPARRSDELRRSWGAGPDDPVALYVSRLAREKNPQLTRRTFEELRRRWPGCRTVVVGDGPAAAEMERQDPESRYCGMRLGEDLAAHYASGDLLLFPSLTETFGNVILEGMASGLAV
ncbi:MAG: glycosyltransferase family 1 protein, partial [Holophagales bacterium]|nr:glycosyltransferase family 1 protein [Holophagales bacterium]